MYTYGNGKVGVSEHLEIEGLVTLVSHIEHCLETVLCEADAVLQAEIVGPGLLHVFAEVGGGEAEVKTDGVVVAFALAGGLGRGLAQKLPVRVPCEAVLREGGCSVIRGGRTEDLQ